jgi:hypothetical protein
MTNLEKNLLDTLLELDRAVNQIKTGGPKPDLQGLFSRLDSLTAQLPKGSNPQLLHYLQKKSYEKALFALQGRDAENPRGGCR